MPGNPTSSRPDDTSAASLPGIPLDSGEPVFREPWEAQAFVMALALHERGVFTWPEWAAALAEEIRSAQAAGDPDLGDTYYRHWLAALEKLVAGKKLILGNELERRVDEWDAAARSTPHGKPIELPIRQGSPGRTIPPKFS